MKSLLGKVFLPLVVLVAAGFSAGYLIASKPKVEPQEPPERIWPVAVAAVELNDIQPTLELYGEVIAGRQVELRPLVTGEVVAVHPRFLNGGIVDADEILLKIDPFEYTAAVDEQRAKLAEAEARLAELQARRQAERDALVQDREMITLSERDLERQSRLAQKGTVSAKLLDQSRMDLARMRQTIAMRKNNLKGEDARIEQQTAAIARLKVGLERAERDLRHTELRAPFAGILDATAADMGRRVSPNEPVARLLDGNRLEAKFTVTDAQYGRLIQEAGGALTGRPVRILWRVGGQELSFAAEVNRIGARIEAASGGVDVYARFLQGALELPIRPGAFVAIEMQDQVYRDVAQLPQTALYEGDTVFAVEQGRTVRRTVSLVNRVRDQVLVRGEIQSGDQIVTTRIAGIGPSLRVEVRTP